MQIMTQDGKRLVNADFISQMFIEETESHEAKLMAATDDDILLGTYKNAEHAEMALRFIGVCLVDEDSQNKITQVPTREDMALKDELFDGKGPAAAFHKLMESVLSKGGGKQKPDSVPDLGEFLASLLND